MIVPEENIKKTLLQKILDIENFHLLNVFLFRNYNNEPFRWKNANEQVKDWDVLYRIMTTYDYNEHAHVI